MGEQVHSQQHSALPQPVWVSIGELNVGFWTCRKKGWAGYWRAETQSLWLLENTDTVSVQGVSWLLESWDTVSVAIGEQRHSFRGDTVCVHSLCTRGEMAIGELSVQKRHVETKLNMCMNMCMTQHVYEVKYSHVWYHSFLKRKKKGMPKRHDTR